MIFLLSLGFILIITVICILSIVSKIKQTSPGHGWTEEMKQILPMKPPFVSITPGIISQVGVTNVRQINIKTSRRTAMATSGALYAGAKSHWEILFISTKFAKSFDADIMLAAQHVATSAGVIDLTNLKKLTFSSDINVEWQKFNANWIVETSDEQAAWQLLNVIAVDRLGEISGSPCKVLASGNFLVTYAYYGKNNATVSKEQLFDDLQNIAALVINRQRRFNRKEFMLKYFHANLYLDRLRHPGRLFVAQSGFRPSLRNPRKMF
jgi:hypothetical protein